MVGDGSTTPRPWRRPRWVLPSTAAEASLTAAQIYLDRPGLMPIVELIHAARAHSTGYPRSRPLAML